MMMNRRTFSTALLIGAAASLISIRGMAANAAPTKARNVVPAAIAAMVGPVVLVGHSYGGSVITERDMTQGVTLPSVTSRAIAIEHIRISSRRPFAEVRGKFERTVPKLDPGIAEVLSSGDQKRAKDYEENGPKLSIFGERNHGALLQIAGSRRNAIQYNIGNPLTATKMTRYQLPAALYAPLRLVLFEDEDGRGIFEYDKPSSLLGQYGDERVTEVGRYLDTTLEGLLRNAAE